MDQPALRDRILALRGQLNKDQLPDDGYRALILSPDHGIKTGDKIYGFTAILPEDLYMDWSQYYMNVLP